MEDLVSRYDVSSLEKKKTLYIRVLFLSQNQIQLVFIINFNLLLLIIFTDLSNI